MAKKKLYKSKSNFTLRRLHQSGSYGNIYERDYLTITNSLERPGGQIPIYNSPTFKLSIQGGLNGRKKYTLGKWCSNPKSCEGVTDNLWLLSCMPEVNEVPEKIKIKPHSKRLTDFACYGSSSELIEASISNIVKKYPAEIFVKEKRLWETGIFESDKSLMNTPMYEVGDWYMVNNPLYIDLMQSVIPEDSQVSPLRYFSQSFTKYKVLSSSGSSLIEGNEMSWDIVSEPSKECIENGDLMATITIGINFHKKEIRCFYYAGNIIYVTNTANYVIRPIQSEVDVFFNNLNEFEKILLNQQTNYTAIFETYIETEEDGWVMQERAYQWPLDEGGWNIAVRGLGYSDYIEKLKSLSIAYDDMFTDAIWRTMTHEAITNMDLTLPNIDENDDITIGKTKMRKTINVIGRQFDEIKKYIDNIKNTNTITYSQNKNLPDYFLSDTLELSGWEVKNILTKYNPSDTTKPLYGSVNKKYTAEDVNHEFMRRLKLNSKQILKEKGTKRGIEDLLAIFGFHSYDWLKKYYTKIDENDLRKAYLLIEYVYVANGYSNDKTPENTIEEVRRLNQIKDSYEIGDINDASAYIDVYDGLPVAEAVMGDKTRLIPWVNRKNKYDSNMYFQMKGGWARNDGDTRTEGTPETPVYDYTISKIHYIKTLDDLYNLNLATVDANGIYYINNQDTFLKIKDINKHNAPEGWETPDEEEIILYQNIIDNNKGNNPHTGEYDNGNSYLLSFGTLFQHSTFENTRNENISNVMDYGFNIERQADSTKCLFFGDLTIADQDGVLRMKNQIKPYNLFSGTRNSYEEEASLSVINSKEFDIVFDIQHRDFIENDIIPYLKQIIPSTTIFSYRFEDLTDDTNKIYQAKTHEVVCNGNICPVYGITQNN